MDRSAVCVSEGRDRVQFWSVNSRVLSYSTDALDSSRSHLASMAWPCVPPNAAPLKPAPFRVAAGVLPSPRSRQPRAPTLRHVLAREARLEDGGRRLERRTRFGGARLRKLVVVVEQARRVDRLDVGGLPRARAVARRRAVGALPGDRQRPPLADQRVGDALRALPTEALQADGICGLSNGVGAPWIVARRARARAWSDSCGAKEESMVVNFQLVVCAAGVAAELLEMPRRG